VQVCIVIFEGEQSKASANRLLGRFDLTGIPPAPARTPLIEVTFMLDAADVLSVTAIDSDTGRHNQWRQANGSIVVKE
jgi:molecular chaperone DnaK (HSP70)